MTNLSVIARALLTALLMLLLMAASIVPGRAEPGDSVFVWAVAKTPPLLQKALHLSLYGLLALLWVWTLTAIQSKGLRLGIAFLVAVAFGATLEWYQTRVPGRFGSLLDVALNATGAILGLLASLVLL